MDAYLVIDLEGTCSEDESVPRSASETIEVGAVIVSSVGRTEGAFNAFVRPALHPTLTRFCTELTTITQADVDQAQEFPIVLAQLVEFAGMHGLDRFYSWGTYDRDQIARDCLLHKVANPFTSHVDMAKLFQRKTGRKRGSRGAMRHFGIQPEGTRHRGIDDALNYSKMIPLLV